MTTDAFGHKIEFRTIVRVGKQRKDGKFQVSYVFSSTGSRFNKIETAEQINEFLAKSPDAEVYGWPR